MIKKTKSGYQVTSKEGKPMSKTLTKSEALKRLAEIEWFKNRGQFMHR